MDNWDEVRTAYQVARMGTVSGAAEVLGVHHATVIRHIDAIEGRLGVKLFQRHARGYTLTDAGQDMLEVAGRADAMFVNLEGRSRSKAGQLSGSLIVTAMAEVSPLVMPAIRDFHLAHPQIALEFLAGTQLARLEHGEAHVAIRTGAKTEVPDYVVTLFGRVQFGLYASQAYIDRAGHPGPDLLDGHRFVGAIGQSSRIPFADWMTSNVKRAALALDTTDQRSCTAPFARAWGWGFLPPTMRVSGPNLWRSYLGDTWSTALWIVTHVDLHRTTKVQAFLEHLKTSRAQPATKA